MSFLSSKSKSPKNASPRNSDTAAGSSKKSFFSASSSPAANDQPQAAQYPPIGPGQLSIHIAGASGLYNPRMFGHIDPYVEITIGNKQNTSKTLNNTTDPTWNFDSVFDLEGNETVAVFEVQHKGFVNHALIGKTEVPLIDLIQQPDQKSFRLFRGHDLQDQAGIITMTLRWLPSVQSGTGFGDAPNVVQSSYQQVAVADSSNIQPVGTGAAVASVAALPGTVDTSVPRSGSFYSDAKAPLTASSTHSGVYEAAFTQPVSQISTGSASSANTRLPLSSVGPTTMIAETATVSTLPIGQVIPIPTTITAIPAELTQPMPTFSSPPWKQATGSASSSSAGLHTERQLSQSSSSGVAETDKNQYHVGRSEGSHAFSSKQSDYSHSSGSDDALTATGTEIREFQRASSASETV